jgi:hypothetical protein
MTIVIAYSIRMTSNRQTAFYLEKYDRVSTVLSIIAIVFEYFAAFI